jgi:hypothetical protein
MTKATAANTTDRRREQNRATYLLLLVRRCSSSSSSSSCANFFLSVFYFLRFLARSFPSRSRVRTHAKQANAACLPPHSQTLTRTYLPHSYRPTYKARYFPTYDSAFYKRGRFTHTHTHTHTHPKNKDIRIAWAIAKIQGWPIRARQHGRDKANILDESP